MLCIVAFVLLACVIVPVAAVAILAVAGRSGKPGSGPYPPAPHKNQGEAAVPPASMPRGLSLPPADGVR